MKSIYELKSKKQTYKVKNNKKLTSITPSNSLAHTHHSFSTSISILSGQPNNVIESVWLRTKYVRPSFIHGVPNLFAQILYKICQLVMAYPWVLLIGPFMINHKVLLNFDTENKFDKIWKLTKNKFFHNGFTKIGSNRS